MFWDIRRTMRTQLRTVYSTSIKTYRTQGLISQQPTHIMSTDRVQREEASPQEQEISLLVDKPPRDYENYLTPPAGTLFFEKYVPSCSVNTLVNCFGIGKPSPFSTTRTSPKLLQDRH